jgi:type II secretory ATPase GspE/PulE/Tfp pilus assembly ATPase PilB-like protein
LTDHHAAHCLAREEGSLQVDGERRVEIPFGNDLGQILRRDPDIVDEEKIVASRDSRTIC